MSIWPRFRVTNYSPNSYRLFRTDKHRHATRPLSRETTPPNFLMGNPGDALDGPGSAARTRPGVKKVRTLHCATG